MAYRSLRESTDRSCGRSLGRHIGHRARDSLRWFELLSLAWQARCEAGFPVILDLVCSAHQKFAGFKSLWTRPDGGAGDGLAMARANRKKWSSFIGDPSSCSSGSLPGSSNISKVRPPSRISSSGRTAQARSAGRARLTSWANRSRTAAADVPPRPLRSRHC